LAVVFVWSSDTENTIEDGSCVIAASSDRRVASVYHQPPGRQSCQLAWFSSHMSSWVVRHGTDPATHPFRHFNFYFLKIVKHNWQDFPS
jgi:hypothetical protein